MMIRAVFFMMLFSSALVAIGQRGDDAQCCVSFQIRDELRPLMDKIGRTESQLSAISSRLEDIDRRYPFQLFNHSRRDDEPYLTQDQALTPDRLDAWLTMKKHLIPFMAAQKQVTDHPAGEPREIIASADDLKQKLANMEWQYDVRRVSVDYLTALATTMETAKMSHDEGVWIMYHVFSALSDPSTAKDNAFTYCSDALNRGVSRQQIAC